MMAEKKSVSVWEGPDLPSLVWRQKKAMNQGMWVALESGKDKEMSSFLEL